MPGVRAIQVTEFGGPEVLRLVDLPEPAVAGGESLLEVLAAGVNYADTHAAENTYLAPTPLPLIPGVEVVGRDPSGRRVLALLRSGGYAERASARSDSLIPLPDAVDDVTALGLGVQGLTAWHILHTCSHIAAGESLVVTAAGGGVGTLTLQLARLAGAGRVIALASTQEKRELALSLGADVAIDSRHEALGDAIREANGGRPVDVVSEMTGGATFDACLAVLAPFGRLVTFGQASRRQPEPIPPGLMIATSRAVIGFWLVHCMQRPEMVTGPMAELLRLVLDGRLRVIAGGTWPLEDARAAHEALRSRATAGKLALRP